MTQTSKIKYVTISLLKHLIGGLLGTTTTLVDHWFMSEASLPQIKTAFLSLTDMFGGVITKAKVTNFKLLVLSESFLGLLHIFSHAWFQTECKHAGYLAKLYDLQPI